MSNANNVPAMIRTNLWEPDLTNGATPLNTLVLQGIGSVAGPFYLRSLVTSRDIHSANR